MGDLKKILQERTDRMKRDRTRLMVSAALLAQRMSPEELRDVAEVLSCYRQTVGTRHSTLELLQQRAKRHDNIKQLKLHDIDTLVTIWDGPDAG